MLFNSYFFIVLFFPIVALTYFKVASHSTRAANIILLLASFVFYFSSSFLFFDLAALVTSIFANYLFGLVITKNRSIISGKYYLTASISANLLFLGYFKYWDFFATNINHLLGTSYPLLDITLPLGISFFTLTQIAYLVGCYKDQEHPTSFGIYSLFVSYFPHLLAGPIVYHNDLVDKFLDPIRKKVNWENISQGISLFAIGLFKKVCIADRFAFYANNGFAVSHTLSGFEAWFVALSYTIQLYFDFSGYADMAVGISQIFNIELPINFNSPYKAMSVQDFWRRWHITLGSFLRTYVYFPLGGNRKGFIASLRNIIIIFFLSGLWHGAAWTFIIWGMLHGIAICIENIWKRYIGFSIPMILARSTTFLFVVITWVIFRAENFLQATSLIKSMLGITGTFFTEQAIHASSLLNAYKNLLFNAIGEQNIFALPKVLIVLLATQMIRKNSNEFVKENKLTTAMLIIILSCLLLGTFCQNARDSQFLYFRF